MEHFRDIQLVRTVEVRNPYGWVKMPFTSIRKGDVFRLTESRVGEKDNKEMPGLWHALSAARHVYHNGLQTLSVECEQVTDM